MQAHIQETLVEQIQIVYASTVRASIRREGEWTQLSYSHHIGYGAKRLAVLALGKKVDGFSKLCNVMAANLSYIDATDFIAQAKRVLTGAYEDLLCNTQLMGQTVFKDASKADPTFWRECLAEWEQGPGYKTRVAGHNRDWFDNEARRALGVELKTLIESEWKQVLDSVTGLLESAMQN